MDFIGIRTGVVFSPREILDSCILALRYFGVWSLGSDHSTFFKLLHTFYNKIVFILICTFAASLLADLCLSYRDLMIVTDDGCFLAGISVIIFKLFNFHFRQMRIQDLINAIHDPVETLKSSSDRAVVMLVHNFVIWEKATVYCLTFLATFLIVALIFFAPTENGSLPIRAKYPFDTTIQPMHSLAFAIQASAVTIGVVTIMAMDTIVIGFCRFTQLQLQVLTANYENCQSLKSPRCSVKIPRGHLGNHENRLEPEEANIVIRGFVPFDPNEANEVDDSFLKRFKICVKHHQRLIKIVDEINELFSSSMLVQLFGSFSMICLTGFQAVLGAKESPNLMKFALYLGAAFSQLLCWCWFGNKLIYQSDSLAASQWSSGWENEKNFPTATMFVILSLIRTRRPMELTAGKFYTMSMETFIAILRSSYSFFALLSNVSVPDDG